MRGNKNNNWVMKIIWLAGLVLVIFGHEYLDRNVLWRLTTPADAILYAWLQFALPLMTGMYLSLVFIWSQFKVKDQSLFLLVALPTFFMALMAPLMATFPLPLPDQFTWLVQALNTGQYLPLVAGMTLLPSRY